MPEDPTVWVHQLHVQTNSHETCPPVCSRPTRACARTRPPSAATARWRAPRNTSSRSVHTERRLRESKGDEQAPKWFKLATDADLHELEQDVGTPVWEWNGLYEESSAKRAAAAVDGANPLESLVFDPWCYEETRSGKAVVGEEGETTEA